MTHRISGDRVDAQICEETRTMVKATDGTALKRLQTGGINLPRGDVWMSPQDANSNDIGMSYLSHFRNIKMDLILKVWYFA